MSETTNGSARRDQPDGKPIAIYYEHPSWFLPLFQQLDERGANWVKVDARNHQYDPGAKDCEFSLLFNRMSPSAWQRGVGHGIFYTIHYLTHLEEKGVRVVNGSRGFTHETSKGLQITLLESLGLPYPRAHVIHHSSQALSAADAVGYPVVIKPNIGGSGAGIERFDSPEQLRRAVEENRLYFGIDSTALIQEAFTPRNGIITRVEVLGGEYLYAIQIHTEGKTFNLCPGDVCQSADGVELAKRPGCPVDAAKNGLTVAGYEPPREIIENVERIMEVAGIEVGGVEYVNDDRTGRLLYYDINALSNFVADPDTVIGFNPYRRLADYLISEARVHVARESARLDLAGARP